ncbi:exosortase C-terminal domain/associated protein EpsI [Thioalkalivibrio sulfidiphilus]|uniref:exosortase C-terminal domain/associated protein EpsI n=1 Tax=Thioalkalivibrio sulfidiphilus TaxID=1033854 RepID=UPI00037D0508|nr:EpsI domain-containing exosortase [Thioalkalivibrio sulfidiphilus]
MILLPPAPRAWPMLPAALGLLGLFVLLVLSHGQSFAALWEVWRKPEDLTYSHGPLLLLIALGIAGYRLWREPQALGWNPSLIGAGLLLAASGLWLVSTLAVVKVGTMLAAWLVLVGGVWSVFGVRGFRILALPLGLLLFTIPLWSVFNEALRSSTALTVDWLLNATGTTTVREGAVLHIAAGSFSVDDTCTGLRQLVVAMPLAFLFAAWIGLKPLFGWVMLGLAITMSFLMNTLRIYVVVLAGAMTDMQHYFVQEDHIGLGWVMFGLGMLALFFTAARLLPDAWFKSPSVSAGTKLRTAEPRLSAGVVSATALGITLLVALLLGRPAADLLPTDPGLQLPERVAGWTREPMAETQGRGGIFPGADLEQWAVYRRSDGSRVLVQMAWFQVPREGHKAVAWENRVYDRARWPQTGHRVIALANGERALSVREDHLVSRAEGERLVWSWYQIGGQRVQSDLSAVAAGILGGLCGRPDSARWLITPMGGGDEAVQRRLLQEFLESADSALKLQVQTLSRQAHPGAWC